MRHICITSVGTLFLLAATFTFPAFASNHNYPGFKAKILGLWKHCELEHSYGGVSGIRKITEKETISFSEDGTYQIIRKSGDSTGTFEVTGGSLGCLGSCKVKATLNTDGTNQSCNLTIHFIVEAGSWQAMSIHGCVDNPGSYCQKAE